MISNATRLVCNARSCHVHAMTTQMPSNRQRKCQAMIKPLKLSSWWKSFSRNWTFINILCNKLSWDWHLDEGCTVMAISYYVRLLLGILLDIVDILRGKPLSAPWKIITATSHEHQDSRFRNAYSINSHGYTVQKHTVSIFQFRIQILVQSIKSGDLY